MRAQAISAEADASALPEHAPGLADEEDFEELEEWHDSELEDVQEEPMEQPSSKTEAPWQRAGLPWPAPGTELACQGLQDEDTDTSAWEPCGSEETLSRWDKKQVRYRNFLEANGWNWDHWNGWSGCVSWKGWSGYSSQGGGHPWRPLQVSGFVSWPCTQLSTRVVQPQVQRSPSSESPCSLWSGGQLQQQLPSQEDQLASLRARAEAAEARAAELEAATSTSTLPLPPPASAYQPMATPAPVPAFFAELAKQRASARRVTRPCVIEVLSDDERSASPLAKRPRVEERPASPTSATPRPSCSERIQRMRVECPWKLWNLPKPPAPPTSITPVAAPWKLSKFLEPPAPPTSVTSVCPNGTPRPWWMPMQGQENVHAVPAEVA